MIAQLLERTVLLVIGLLLLTTVVFWISNSRGSNDLVELIGDNPLQRYGSTTQLRAHVDEIKRKKGTNLPLFYFSLGDAGNHPELNTIALPSERANIEDLARFTNQPRAAMEWHRILVKAEQECDGADCRKIIDQTRRYSEPSKIRAHLKNGKNALSDQLLDGFNDRFRKKSVLWKLIPHFWWNGSTNRWHHWVFGNSSSGGVIQGDFGVSGNYGLPVSDLLGPAFSRTFRFAIPALLLGITLGVMISLWRTRRLKPPGNKNLLLAMYLMPSFWLGSIFLTVFCNPDLIGWFAPAYSLAESGGILNELQRSFLPVLTWTIGIAGYTGVISSGALESIHNDTYLKAAYAKGLSESQVAWRHRLPVIALTILSVFQQIAPLVFAGSVAIEVIFSINGIGKLTYDALLAEDQNVVFASVLVIGTITLLLSWLVDILSKIVDPRLKGSPE